MVCHGARFCCVKSLRPLCDRLARPICPTPLGTNCSCKLAVSRRVMLIHSLCLHWSGCNLVKLQWSVALPPGQPWVRDGTCLLAVNTLHGTTVSHMYHTCITHVSHMYQILHISLLCRSFSLLFLVSDLIAFIDLVPGSILGAADFRWARLYWHRQHHLLMI